MHKRILQIYFFSLLNEISVEKNILSRLYNNSIDFTPVRVIKTLPFIRKYKISKYIYLIINIFYIFVVPVFFLFKIIKYILIKMIFNRNNSQKIGKTLILVSNSRVYELSKRIFIKNVTYLEINGHKLSEMQNKVNLLDILTYKDLVKAYFYALLGVSYSIVHLKEKTDIMQNYVAYDWFLTYIALDKIKHKIRTVVFANHYDRWATMYDNVFRNNELILIQHGMLPKDLILAYKLKNINVIYVFNKESEITFKKIFSCSNTIFKKLDISIILQKTNDRKKTILIIGQPHSIDIEIKIIKKIKENFDVKIYVKPHPLYSIKEYEKITGIEIIKNKKFFPKVDLVLSYESTLGLEYEASGIKVIWFKDKELETIIKEINTKLQ